MPTRALPELLDQGVLVYEAIDSPKHPKGKTYRVPPPTSLEGARWAAMGELILVDNPTAEQVEKLSLSDDAEQSFYEMVLKSTLGEMQTDGVAWPRVRQVALDVFTYWAINPESADALLASQGEEVARSNRAQRRAAAKKQPASKRAAGSSSSRASGAAPQARKGRTSTRGSSTSAAKNQAAKRTA